MKLLLLLALPLLFIPLTTFAGRFEIMQLGTARADQYMLDTQTGRLWHSVCAHGSTVDCDYSIWEPMDVVGISAKPSDIGRNIATLKRRDKEKAEGTSP